MPKNFAQKHHFILAKLLKFQETFLEKFLVSGFGATPQHITLTQKKHGAAVLFNLSLTVGTAVPNLRFKGLFEKSPLKIRKNFPQIYHFILVKLLRFQRTFHEKSFVSGFGAEAPTFNARKKARQRRAFLLYNFIQELLFLICCCSS